MVMDGNNPSMQGTLRKWTNYFSGWQPRWFVLNNGVLAYYKSQEDVVNGCKGSVKMSVCDVGVHPGDNTRLDLIIPGEAYFYVKATTPQERQQWLVALGSSKAGLSANGLPATGNGEKSKDAESLPEDSLKAKKSELRLYCDLLMQQVHSVKSSVSEKPSNPDIQQLDDATTLLSATCDTFIKTLEECMKLSHANKNSPSHAQRSASYTDSTSTSPMSSRRPSINRAISAPEPPTNVPRNLLPTMEEQFDSIKR